MEVMQEGLLHRKRSLNLQEIARKAQQAALDVYEETAESKNLAFHTDSRGECGNTGDERSPGGWLFLGYALEYWSCSDLETVGGRLGILSAQEALLKAHLGPIVAIGDRILQLHYCDAYDKHELANNGFDRDFILQNYFLTPWCVRNNGHVDPVLECPDVLFRLLEGFHSSEIDCPHA